MTRDEFTGTITVESQVVIGPEALAVLKQIMWDAGVVDCTVTSGVRTPADQARIMYENCQLHGLQSQYNLYGPFGDKVLDVYAANVPSAIFAKQDVIQLMVDKILELGPQNVSHHCSIDRWVWDVGPASIPEEQHTAFLSAAQANPKIVKLLSPYTVPKDPAFHFEMMRTIVT
jgi:hypothetical protein